MSKTTPLPKIKKAAQQAKSGIQCEFKPKPSKRKIRFASDKDAAEAGRWAVDKYSDTFRDLAK